MKFLLLIAAFQLVLISILAEELYRGNQLLRISIEEEDDARWMKSLEETSSGTTLDFWTSPVPGRKTDIMVTRGYVDEFKSILRQRELSFDVIMVDVQENVNNERSQTTAARRAKRDLGTLALQDFDYSIYHTFEEIQQWTRDIAEEYSSFVNLFTFGYTFEGREILALEITAPAAEGASDPKPIVYFEGGIHCREWISPATVMFFTSQFLKNYVDNVDNATRTLGMYDFHIVPLLNCDGYVYTWEVERLWRKSRQENPDFGCVGTDMNRNFDAFWGGEGASPWPCSIIYRGFVPLNHNETRAIDDHFQKLRAANRVTKVFIDWHSYSQLILAPWSYSADVDPPEDTDKQIAAAGAMAKAMNETHNVPEGYIHGVGTDILYVSAGTSKDYGYASTPGATYSYTVELRDTGEYGFLLPADQIIPTGEESYNGVVAMMDWITANDYD